MEPQVYCRCRNKNINHWLNYKVPAVFYSLKINNGSLILVTVRCFSFTEKETNMVK